jgi:soluble lytic murein transglycosylase-like protein
MKRKAFAIAALVLVQGKALACWDDVGRKYGISPQLLYAMAKTESNVNPAAFNRNRNGTYDVGLMQINSSWFPTLRKYGISEKQLYEPCINMEVGAWILAQNMQKHGNSWNAVGAYNAANPVRRLEYARRVYRNLPVRAELQPQGCLNNRRKNKCSR